MGVNQRYCIATSTKADLKGADFSKITDKYFAREAGKKGEKKFKKGEDAMFAGATEKTGASAEKKAGQKNMDEAILKNLTPDLKSYLKARFSLSANMYPHELKF